MATAFEEKADVEALSEGTNGMDWRKNRIAVGAVVFVALLGLTLWAVNRRDREPTNTADLPTLELTEEAITRIEINRPSGETVVLSNASGAWRVVAPLEAEADENNVETALNRLTDLRIARLVATRPENYERLQVDDSNAVEVVVKGEDETLHELAIGKYADGMTMVRIDDRPEVFGASGSLRYAFDRDLRTWRNRRVTSEDAAQVSTIRFESSNGTFEFDRDGETWKVSTGAKLLDELDPKKVTGIVSTAARLMAADFAPQDFSLARAGLSEPKATVKMIFAEKEEPIVLELGASAEENNEVYLRRKGDETIYLISEYLAKRLQPDGSSFEKIDEPPAPPTPTTAPPRAQQGQPQLPPEVMRQIREQIEAQQQGR
jgi:hypothetical protein